MLEISHLILYGNSIGFIEVLPESGVIKNEQHLFQKMSLA